MAAPEMFREGGILEEARRRAVEVESGPVRGGSPRFARSRNVQLYGLHLRALTLDKDLAGIKVVSHLKQPLNQLRGLETAQKQLANLQPHPGPVFFGDQSIGSLLHPI